MTGRSVSAVTAYTAHREWASRPPDERYASVHALYEAARARRQQLEERTIETGEFRTEAVDDDLAFRESSGRTATLTHWSFGQLATIAGAPPNYLRTLPRRSRPARSTTGCRGSSAHSISCSSTDTAPWTVHAITSPRYARVHHDELASRVLDLMAQHPAWHLPLGYKDGEFGAEKVPSGAYLGDRDMFLFLVDGNRDLDDPTDRTHAGLFRGFILRNSDVGAAALTLDVFLFRMVCGNHLIWGFQHVAGFRRRHVGASIQDAWTTSLERRPRSTRRRYRRRSDDAPARNRPGARADARRGARDGRSATRSVAEAGRRGVHTRGAVRGESPFRLGLRAGTDTSQSAHALAGRTVHTRSRRRSPPHHGPLTLVRSHAGTSPRGAHHPHPNRGRPRPPAFRHASTRARVAIPEV